MASDRGKTEPTALAEADKTNFVKSAPRSTPVDELMVFSGENRDFNSRVEGGIRVIVCVDLSGLVMKCYKYI